MQPRKLLIAESSEEYRVALAESLTGEYHVRTCADGIQTQQLLRSFQPDILVLDLMLPGMDGITLLQLAREEGPLPMVLAQSRYISDFVLDALGNGHRICDEQALYPPGGRGQDPGYGPAGMPAGRGAAPETGGGHPSGSRCGGDQYSAVPGL